MSKKKKNKPLDDYEGEQSFPARLQSLAFAWQKLAAESLKKRQALLRLAASGYFDEGYTRNHCVNLVDRGVQAVVPYLIEGNPKVQVESRAANYRPWAYTTQMALNYFIQKINLAKNVFIPAATNSLFGAAITRTDFYYDRMIGLNDETIRLGTPWVELIDDSNYIGDPSAKRRCDMVFEGDCYKLPTEYAKDFFAGKDGFGNQIADYIHSDGRLEQEFSPREILDNGYDKSRLSLREYTTFIDIYLRDERTIVTIMPKGKKAKILRTRDWDAPGDGPYDYLGYKFFPESTIPIPPAWAWHDMDVTVNILVNKMREMAENQKDIIAFSADASEDMKKIQDAPNLGTVQVSDVSAMKEISLNGIKDSSNWQWVNFMLAEHTKAGANPDILGGRGPQAQTLGQEQMVFENASRVVNNMYSRYQDFMTSIICKLAWAFWTDPSVYVPVIKEIPGTVALPEVFSSIERCGDFYDFVFDVVPYSTQRMSPEIRYSRLIQFLSSWILPTMELAAQQGAALDIPTVSKILGEYADITSMNQWYKTAVPEPGDVVAYQMQPQKNVGQGNDSLGSLPGSREANKNQQQERTTGSPEGMGGQTQEAL